MIVHTITKVRSYKFEKNVKFKDSWKLRILTVLAVLTVFEVLVEISTLKSSSCSFHELIYLFVGS